MANNNNDGAEANLDTSKDSGLDKSFVGKFVTGLLNNTPLSKWFGSPSQTRKRDDSDEEDDVSYVLQPPVKRARLPSRPSVPVLDAPNNVNSASNKSLTNKFPEPVAGPSGCGLFIDKPKSGTNKLSSSVATRTTNGEQDDNESGSEESTSGYSSTSRVLKKDQQCDSAANAHQTQQIEDCLSLPRSLFNTSKLDESESRSLFSSSNLQMNTSLSTRRPNFNPSSYETPSQTRTERTMRKERKILDSPFYNGLTTYGGASAYEKHFVKGEALKSTRNAVQIKPINQRPAQTDSVQLSKTARRILSTLEQYGTPIAEEKIDSVTTKRSGILTNYIGATPYVIRDRKKPSNTELQVPTVPELLRMKHKEQLQKSTESVRQVASSSNSLLNKETEYKLRTDKDDKKPKHTGKIKSSVTAQIRKKPTQPAEEEVTEVNLPQVPLPITTLPKINLGISLQKDTETQNTSKPKEDKKKNHDSVQPEKKEKEKKVKIIENKKLKDFVFSRPNVISENFKSVPATNCFKFSEPIKKKDEDNEKKKRDSVSRTTSDVNKMKNNGEHVKLAKDEQTDSLPPLKSTTSGKWECQTCLVWNESSKKYCVACEEPKPDSTAQKHVGNRNSHSGTLNNNLGENIINKVSDRSVDCNQNSKNAKGTSDKSADKSENSKTQCQANFGNKFQPAANTWECPSCMIRNKQDATKCAACETAKPGTKSLPSLTKSFIFGNKAGSSQPPQQWQCQTCLIKNNNELVKCAACEMPRLEKPDKPVAPSFGNTFKPQPSEWECNACMVRNKNSSTTCVCCGSHKPSTTADAPNLDDKSFENPPTTLFNFGVTKAGNEQFKFGIPPAVTNEQKQEPPQFKFGLPPDKGENKKELIVANIPFGTPPPKVEDKKQTKFDIPQTKAEDKKEIQSAPTTTSTSSDIFKSPVTSSQPTFTFGAFAPNKSENADTIVQAHPQIAVTPKQQGEKIASAPAGGFQFGFGGAVNKKVEEPPKVAANKTNMFGNLNKPSNPSQMSTSKPMFEFKQVNGDLDNGHERKLGTNLGTNTMADENNKVPSGPVFKFGFSQPADVTKATSNNNSFFSPSPNPTDSNQVVPIKRSNPDNNANQFNNGFGASPKIPAFSSTTTSIFGQSKPFAFGPSSTPENVAPPPTFGFAQQEKPHKLPFDFSSPPPQLPQPQNQSSSGFNFTMTSVPNTGFNFGQPANIFGGASTSDQSKNGNTFNFGPAAEPQKNLFNFGATDNTAKPTFGNLPAQQSATFNFGPAAGLAPAVPDFGFTNPPPFDYHSGTSSGQQQQQQHNRKIRRAVRRTAQR